jgi:uncharacterized protein YcnI
MMMKTVHSRVTTLMRGAAVTAACFSAAAWGHIVLETREAVSGSYYKATFQVSHGCEGSPTVRLRVRIPEGVIGAKPQPKPGWQLSTVKVKLAAAVAAGHGKSIGETVGEVVWSGGNLPNDYFDEFKIAVKLPDRPGTTLYFPVVQECQKGVHRWIEIPSGGTEPKEPAPGLRLTSKP